MYIKEGFNRSLELQSKLKNEFHNMKIDNLTDLNYSTSYTYFISLNKDNEGIYDKELDLLLDSEKAYFIEVSFSNVINYAYAYFLQYERKNNKEILNTSEKPYLKSHFKYLKIIEKFCKCNNINLINKEFLSKRISLTNENVNIYFRYFNQENENKNYIPF